VKKDRRIESLTAEISKLKEDRRTIDGVLKTAKESLTTSIIPGIAEVGKLNEEISRLTSERDSLQRKLDSTTRDFEYTRQQYQHASSTAVETAKENAELHALIADLEKKASGEAVKVRSMSVQRALEQSANDNERLALELEEAKELLRKKERGKGVTTRAGSVAPRSPRLGEGHTPGGSRAGSRAPGSRGASPVLGFLEVRKGRGPVD
jgi:chromosome segregation ATPase